MYALAGTGPFVEDLVDQFNLGTTPALTEFRGTFAKKMREVSQEFYKTAAMTDERWKGPLQDLRHLITRLATHGFHNELCTRRDCHRSLCLSIMRPVMPAILLRYSRGGTQIHTQMGGITTCYYFGNIEIPRNFVLYREHCKRRQAIIGHC